MGGAGRGCGTILRGAGRGGATAGDAAEGTAAGATGAAGAFGGAAGFAGGGGAGFTGMRAWRASSSSSFFLAKTAFITSPGLEMCERSIFGVTACGARADAALGWGAGRAGCARRARTFSASSSSSELE